MTNMEENTGTNKERKKEAVRKARRPEEEERPRRTADIEQTEEAERPKRTGAAKSKNSTSGKSSKNSTNSKNSTGSGSRKHSNGSGRRSSRKRRRRRQRMLWNIAMAAAVVVFVCSAVMLVRTILEYKNGTDTYDKVAEQVVEAPEEETTEETGQDAETEAKMAEVPYVNLDNLKLINSDAQGWILFPDTTISYPVVQGTDNEYYLTHMIDGTVNSAGTLFVEKSNQAGFADKNTIIYGHNMKNGSMFGQLKKYGEEEYYQEHPFFYLYTDAGVWQYDIISVRVVDESSDSYTIGFVDDASFAAYLDQAHRTSMYDATAQAEATGSIVTLSTCTSRDTDRLIVQAVRGEQVR